jgi:hypothetical protein
MCGQSGCDCGHGSRCGRHGHQHGGGGHDEGARCACGDSCECEQAPGGCQCEGDESQGCGCGQGEHEEHHGRCEHHGHHAAHALGFQRRFISRAERIAGLEGYLSELRDEMAAGQAYLQDVQAEATAVEERIASLKAA